MSLSRPTWGVIVAALFAIAAWVTPVPERWRSMLILLTWVALGLSCLGWLGAHFEWTRKLRSRPVATRPMTVLVIFCVGGLLTVGAWFLVPKLVTENTPSPNPASAPDLVGQIERPIAWNFDGSLALLGEDVDTDNPRYRAKGFSAVGKNTGTTPITKLGGYVEIDRTRQKFPMLLNRDGNPVDLSKLVAIPVGENVTIVSFFTTETVEYSAWKGIETNQFLKLYTPFTFVAIINNKEYRYSLSTERCREIIDRFINSSSPIPKGPVFKN